MAATVPSSDPVYGIVDEISATVPVHGFIVGQRPWSRRELARIIVAFEAAEHSIAGSSGPPFPDRVRSLIDSLAVSHGADICELTGGSPCARANMARIRSVSLDVIGTNSLPRSIPASNGLGYIDAVTNPLEEPRWGRPVAHGATADAEFSTELGLGTHFAVAAQPRFSWLQPEAQSGYEQADFQRLYARGTFFNIGVEAGLDEVLWGQAGERGMLLSANPRPLHAISVANDTAFALPWILRHLGPMRAALIVADLGNDQHFPGSKLVSYKLNIAPTSRLELGAALLDEMGGSGSPRCSFGCQVKDLFPYVFWIIHPASDPLATNKVAEAEARYRVPEWAGLTLTYEGDMDDFDLRRIRSTLWDNTGHLIGARFDRLTPGGRLALDLQVHHTGLTLYEHTQYKSGLTYRRSVVGDPLGVNGSAAYGELVWRQSIRTQFKLATAWESRDASSYKVHMNDASGSGWTFVKISEVPAERRGRLTLALDRQVFGSGLGCTLLAGLERVSNDDFLAGRSRTNGLAELVVRRFF